MSYEINGWIVPVQVSNNQKATQPSSSQNTGWNVQTPSRISPNAAEPNRGNGHWNGHKLQQNPQHPTKAIYNDRIPSNDIVEVSQKDEEDDVPQLERVASPPPPASLVLVADEKRAVITHAQIVQMQRSQESWTYCERCHISFNLPSALQSHKSFAMERHKLYCHQCRVEYPRDDMYVAVSDVRPEVKRPG